MYDQALKQVRKYRIDAYSWRTLNWIEAPELQIRSILQNLITLYGLHFQDEVNIWTEIKAICKVSFEDV